MSDILITGATGFLGNILIKKFIAEGNKITVFTRSSKSKNQIPSDVKIVEWDYRSPDKWSEVLNQNEIIIHLAGANLFGQRWNKQYKRILVETREESTKNIVAAIRKNNTCVKTLITASAIGYYGETSDTGVGENAAPGKDFLAEICKRWEAPSILAEDKNVRRVNMRMGLIFSTREGYLSKLLLPFRLFIGGPLGSRKNYLSWIHIDDVINSFLFAIKREDIQGPVNIVSPNPVRMGEFASILGKIMKRPSFFQVPAFAIKMLVGEFGSYVTYSQKVHPEILKKYGFPFRYSELETALKDLLQRKI